METEKQLKSRIEYLTARINVDADHIFSLGVEVNKYKKIAEDLYNLNQKRDDEILLLTRKINDLINNSVDLKNELIVTKKKKGFWSFLKK
jgi:hypothetical protein